MKKQESNNNTGIDTNGVTRRHFIKITGITTLGMPFASINDLKAQGVSIVSDPGDRIAQSGPVLWAVKELEESMTSQGIAVKRFTKLAQVPAGNLCIVAGATKASIPAQLLKEAKTSVPAVPEALGLVSLKSAGKQVLLAAGHDERGLVYALLELADRVQNSAQPLASLNVQKPIVERPANEIRSLTRLFTSDVEDKPWYNDREMWPKYLTMLATQRYNRFNLSFGIGYDFLRNVTDGYFLFAYPFFLSVPGYNVRVPQLPDAERDSNLAMLKFISEQTVARGMQFQLGLWMHGYEWLNSPNPNYTNEGITKENHGPYCRDAVRALLKACPAISGVTFRVHGESGVNEGSYEFWRTVFEGVATCGRTVEIDMHSKGMDQTMMDSAVATKMPVVISPKYWAEHMGMPYHQADIRELEVPKPEKKTSVLMNLSEGSRSFLRYGYGDLLKEDRPYKIIHRIWPGTQRLLLWGDPLTAAAHARAFSFCGSAGVELMEPLSFKGRRGSGIAGDRCGYADASLSPRWDWEKYLYTLRVFGRLQYNPQSEPDVWKRLLRKQYGPAADSTEQALANATRILPIVLTAHGTSAGNNTYWPEIYTNHPIADPNIKHPYSDTPAPKVFGNVTPLDPQLFLSINDYAREVLKGERCGKYTPIETAQWIEDYADAAAKHLQQAEAKTQNSKSPEFRRMAIDVSMQVLLGRFFGAKFRSGVLYALYEQSGNRAALQESLKAYKRARGYFAELANNAKDVYKPDITVGERPHLRGHWLDRLPAMDEDISYMAKKLDEAKSNDLSKQELVNTAVQEALGRPKRLLANCTHSKPEKFSNNQPLILELSAQKMPRSVKLFYRHVNQGERYQSAEMQVSGKSYRATIPAAYTNTKYPLEYYFELQEAPASASLYPGFNPDLTNQPYFVVRQV
ncbi:MAG: hypothetical protein JWQ40_328 [Segetibacter sp.]|nr:hypothetical protein [Segetibacter sp.]